jgi:hypothetical protein
VLFIRCEVKTCFVVQQSCGFDIDTAECVARVAGLCSTIRQSLVKAMGIANCQCLIVWLILRAEGIGANGMELVWRTVVDDLTTAIGWRDSWGYQQLKRKSQL